eukprot:2718063-Prymnesium_polylepis.1
MSQLRDASRRAAIWEQQVARAPQGRRAAFICSSLTTMIPASAAVAKRGGDSPIYERCCLAHGPVVYAQRDIRD